MEAVVQKSLGKYFSVKKNDGERKIKKFRY